MAGKGEPKTGGRKKGVLNKSTQDIKSLASVYGPSVIIELARLATEAVNEQTRVSACKEILDRVYGKASQVVEHGGKHGSPIELSNVTDMELARRAAFVLARADLNKDS